MNKKLSGIFETIYATIMTLGFIAADAGWIYWAVDEAEFVVTMFTVSWILITLAINAKVWFKTVKRNLEL